MKKILPLVLLVSMYFSQAYQVLAQGGTNNIGPTVGSGTQTTLSVKRLGDVGVQSVGRLISAAFNVAIIVAGIFVFGMLIMGGYGWITAGGDKTKVEEARTRITNAIIGIAIVASAWAIVMIVGQFFGFSITNLKIPTATGLNTAGQDTGGGL